MSHVLNDTRPIARVVALASLRRWSGAGAIFEPLSHLGVGVNGLAWIALGIGLVRGRRRPAPTG